MVKKSNIKAGALAICGAISVFIILALVFLFMNGMETRTNEHIEQQAIAAISCSANGVENYFFDPNAANSIENVVKITFVNDKMDKMIFSYNGVYSSDSVAENDEANLHAKYNEYMGERSINPNILSPNFSRVKNNLQITLYIDDINNINNTTATFFFLDNDAVGNFKTYSIDQAKEFYEKKGFSCRDTQE